MSAADRSPLQTPLPPTAGLLARRTVTPACRCAPPPHRCPARSCTSRGRGPTTDTSRSSGTFWRPRARHMARARLPSSVPDIRERLMPRATTLCGWSGRRQAVENLLEQSELSCRRALEVELAPGPLGDSCPASPGPGLIPTPPKPTICPHCWHVSWSSSFRRSRRRARPPVVVPRGWGSTDPPTSSSSAGRGRGRGPCP